MIQRTLLLLLLPSFVGFSTTSSHAQVTVVNERGINTAFQEYSPAFYQKGLIFIASNPAVNKDKKEDTQLGKSTTSIFFAKRGNDGNLQRPVTFAEELTTKFYDGPLSFNAAGDVVYFTRTNLKKGKPQVGRDGKVKLKIYTSKLNADKGRWGNIEELPFNSNDFDCMHPSVSADGQRLYFASNRPGGKGGLDIYVSLLQNAKWSEPVNLGPVINTSKDEVFPFIHPDNTLYFSTNGRKAIGGIDIFWTKKTQEGWLDPEAMPEPINSPSNDFGIIVTDDKKSGFFSSNRASGQGDDDIFSFVDNGLDTQSVNNIIEPDETQNKTESTKIEEPLPLQPVKEVKEKTKQEEKVSEKLAIAKPQIAQTTPVVEKKENSNVNTVDVEISAIDKTNNKPIKDVNVSVLNMKSIKNATFLTDATGKVTGLRAESGASIPLDILPSQDVVTDVNGRIKLTVNAGERFIFNFSKQGYDSKYIVKTVASGDSKVAAFMLKPQEKPVIVNSKGLKAQKDTIPTRFSSSWDEGQQRDRSNDFEEPQIVLEDNDPVSGAYTFELKNIYYGHGDAEVNEEAKTELLPLLKMMTKDQQIEIEIGSHTDSKNKANFNLTLSQLRADNIKTFFVENGIKPDRIRAFGYGETMTRNRCKRGVNCSEEEHAFNRRSVIKVVKGIETQTIVESEKPKKNYGKPVKIPVTEGGDFIASSTYEVANVATPRATVGTTSTSDASNVQKRQYHVVIGTFTKPENAMKKQRIAIEAGFVESEVFQDTETFLYSVSVRLFSDQKEARKLADYINSQKEFDAFVKEWK